MLLPLASPADLEAEERWVLAELERMDSAVVVDLTNWQNRRDSLEEHLSDVRLQLAGRTTT